MLFFFFQLFLSLNILTVLGQFEFWEYSEMERRSVYVQAYNGIWEMFDRMACWLKTE